MQSKAAIIHSCYATNEQNFTNKKRKSLGAAASKKKVKIKQEDIELTPETIAVSEKEGVSEESLKRLIAKFFNGDKPLNKKR